MEVGLKALGKAIGVGLQNDWGAYIREIEKELAARVKAAGKRTPDVAFYSEIVANSTTSKQHGAIPRCMLKNCIRRNKQRRSLALCGPS